MEYDGEGNAIVRDREGNEINDQMQTEHDSNENSGNNDDNGDEQEHQNAVQEDHLPIDEDNQLNNRDEGSGEENGGESDIEEDGHNATESRRCQGGEDRNDDDEGRQQVSRRPKRVSPTTVSYTHLTLPTTSRV